MSNLHNVDKNLVLLILALSFFGMSVFLFLTGVSSIQTHAVDSMTQLNVIVAFVPLLVAIVLGVLFIKARRKRADIPGKAR